MYVGKRLYISYKVSDRNMNLMEEEQWQPTRKNFKHRISYIEQKGIREKRGAVAQQTESKSLTYFLKNLEGWNVVFSLGFQEFCNFQHNKWVAWLSWKTELLLWIKPDFGMKVTVWDAHSNSKKPVFSEGEPWLFFSWPNSYCCH